MWGAPRAGQPGVGARAHGGTPRGVHRSPPPPAAQGPRPLGEPQLNWTFCPGHRTRSPHGLGCSKRNSKSDADHPIRPLENRPSLTPTLDHLNVLKVHFVLKDGTSIFPVSLRECLSAVPVLNPPSFHLRAPRASRCRRHLSCSSFHVPKRGVLRSRYPPPSRQNAQLRSASPETRGSQELICSRFPRLTSSASVSTLPCSPQHSK